MLWVIIPSIGKAVKKFSKEVEIQMIGVISIYVIFKVKSANEIN